MLVTGEVERSTDFERGFPLQYARASGGWQPDPWVWDDQALVIQVRNKGLVILSPCGHAEIINIVRHAQRVTEIQPIAGLIGGFHLTGGIFEPIIPRTIDEPTVIGPAVIVPGHCTGWKAIHAIARRLPEAYLQTSVGTKFQFTCA